MKGYYDIMPLSTLRSRARHPGEVDDPAVNSEPRHSLFVAIDVK